MTEPDLAKRVVEQMYRADGFSAWLGIEILAVAAGKAKLRMTVRREMLNGFKRCHGGIPFSLADSALAFASNSHGRVALSVENSIAYPAAILEHDVLTASCEEVSLRNKIATYHVTITKQDDSVVGIFRGTVYRTTEEFFKEK